MRLLCVSDFNLQSLAAELARPGDEPAVEPIDAPFGQVAQLLLDPAAPGWAESPDVVLVWTRPEAVVESWARACAGEPVSPEDVLADVDAFVDLLGRIEGRAATVLVPLWAAPANRRTFATSSLNDPSGPARLLARMNLRLLERLDGMPGFLALDAPAWLATVGAGAWSPKMWAMGKIPFGNDLFREAAAAIKAALRGVTGRSRKLVILDLDDTLWGGIVGDDGMEGLRLGGHDPVGEAYADFQRALKALTRRGIALGIVSKNEEETALRAIREHPEMVLRLEDFAGWRINWQDKAANVADLAAEINVGLDSVVFLDDNPVERGRVAEALPDVLVPEMPRDPSGYVPTLEGLRCFDPPSLSEEDRERASMYTAERQRKTARTDIADLDSWLVTLGTVVTCEPLGPENLTRCAQLLNKTNQMNMTTRRLPEAELTKWVAEAGRRFWAFRVRDKHGDLGLTGLLSVEPDGNAARIVDFVLSCRVMGRRVEETMLAHAVAWAREAGLAEVTAEPVPTEKNAPCLRFFRESALERDEDERVYRWDAAREFPVPASVELTTAGG